MTISEFVRKHDLKIENIPNYSFWVPTSMAEEVYADWKGEEQGLVSAPILQRFGIIKWQIGRSALKPHLFIAWISFSSDNTMRSFLHGGSGFIRFETISECMNAVEGCIRSKHENNNGKCQFTISS